MVNTILSLLASAFIHTHPVEKPYVVHTARVTYYWGDKHTSTGNKPVSGKTIAVDPKIIPYNSKVVIPNMGKFVAHDTGPAVVKKTAAIRLGRKDAIVVDVYCKNKAEAEKLIKKYPKFILIKVYKEIA